jgi:hypothetical protein
MSDENEENPETGAGDGESIPVAGPGTEDAIGQDAPTRLQPHRWGMHQMVAIF